MTEFGVAPVPVEEDVEFVLDVLGPVLVVSGVELVVVV